RIAIAITADPRTEPKQQRQLRNINVQPILTGKRRRNFLIQLRQGGEDGDVIVIQPHLDLIVHRRPSASNFIRFPYRCYFSNKLLLQARYLFVRNRNPVEFFKEFAYAPPLEENRAPCDLGWVSRKHWDNEDALQPVQSLRCGNTDALHFAQSAAQRTAL